MGIIRKSEFLAGLPNLDCYPRADSKTFSLDKTTNSIEQRWALTLKL